MCARLGWLRSGAPRRDPVMKREIVCVCVCVCERTTKTETALTCAIIMPGYVLGPPGA
jgi:hypothetical protein